MIDHVTYITIVDRKLSHLMAHAEETGQSTTIRRTAVREIGVSRHHWDIIEGPPETPLASLNYGIEGLKGVLN